MPETDIEAVKRTMVDTAVQILTKFKENFPPFGVFYSGADHKIELVPMPPDAVPNQSDAHVAWLNQKIRSMISSRKITAAGVCKDVTLTLPGRPSTSAIHCMLESNLGFGVDEVVPYRRGFFGKIKLDKPIRGRGEVAIFPPGPLA